MTAGEIALMVGLLFNAVAISYSGYRATSAAREAADVVKATNARIDKNAAAVDDKLTVIHTLVNSNLTAAVQDQLDARAAQLATMIEIVDMRKTSGAQPGADTLATMEALREKIEELKTALAERQLASERVDRREKTKPA